MRSISFPFRLDGFGHIATTTDNTRIWADRVRAVVSTYPSERVMRPTYGSSAGTMVFGVVDQVPELLDSELASTFATWLPAINYAGVNIVDQDGGTISVNVKYSLTPLEKNSDSVYTVTL